MTTDQHSPQPQPGTDKRRDMRLANVATVFIEVAAESWDGAEPAEILISNSVDVSANGLQITADQPLIEGAIHQAAIKLSGTPSRIPLTVQVKWLREAENRRDYHIGLHILEDGDSDIAHWKMDLSELLEADFDTD